MADKTVGTCVHCGRRIVRVMFVLGPEWMHQPQGSSNRDRTERYCRRTHAEPMRQGGMIVSGNED